MTDKASATRSLSTIRTELEYLRDSSILAPAQFQSIMAQLPVPLPPPPLLPAIPFPSLPYIPSHALSPWGDKA